MTRFHKFFAASILTLVTSASTLAGEMSFPRNSTATQTEAVTEQAVTEQNVDPVTEVLVIVFESLLPIF